MSLNTGSRNVTTALMAKLTPECNNLGRSIKTSATFVCVMVILALVLLVTAIIYSYVKKVDDTNADASANKKKVVGGLSITASVVLAVTTFIALWQFNVAAKTVKICMSN